MTRPSVGVGSSPAPPRRASPLRATPPPRSRHPPDAGGAAAAARRFRVVPTPSPAPPRPICTGAVRTVMRIGKSKNALGAHGKCLLALAGGKPRDTRATCGGNLHVGAAAVEGRARWPAGCSQLLPIMHRADGERTAAWHQECDTGNARKGLGGAVSAATKPPAVLARFLPSSPDQTAGSGHRSVRLQRGLRRGRSGRSAR